MPGTQHIDRDALRELREVMGEDFHVLVSTFLADSQVRLAALRRALATADAGALREAAHSFKGSSLNIGAGPLGALCLELESRAAELPAALVDAVEAEYRQVAALLAGETGRA